MRLIKSYINSKSSKCKFTVFLVLFMSALVSIITNKQELIFRLTFKCQNNKSCAVLKYKTSSIRNYVTLAMKM
jgi:hypothetical protein